MSDSVSGSTLSTHQTAPSTRTFVPSSIAPSTNNNGTGRGASGNGSTTSTGRGGGRRNNRQQQRSDRSNRSAAPRVPRSNFKGNTEGMNGHTFECYDESGDRTQFSKTVDALKEYSAKNLKRPEDLRPMFEDDMKEPHIEAPDDIFDDATTKEVFLWQASMKTYNLRSDELKSNLNSLYSVIWGQSSESMKTKLRSLNDYTVQTQKDNCVWLLKQIKGIMHQFDVKQNILYSLNRARFAYMNCKQEPQQTNSDYFDLFRTTVEVLEYYNATVSESPDVLTGTEFATMSVTEKNQGSTRLYTCNGVHDQLRSWTVRIPNGRPKQPILSW